MFTRSSKAAAESDVARQWSYEIVSLWPDKKHSLHIVGAVTCMEALFRLHNNFTSIELVCRRCPEVLMMHVEATPCESGSVRMMD